MRKNPLVTGEYYHVYNRGVDKRDIFMCPRELRRFVQSVKEFNTVNPIGSIRDKTSPGVGHLGKDKETGPLVSIVCYCFNPNHFHFILKQEVDGGISEFFKRLLGGYAKYFNQVHKRNGALFQGKFKSHLLSGDEYFLKIRPYVHINYLIHDIPAEKTNLVWASDREYNTGRFDLVSKKEADDLLCFYGDNENFKKECSKVVSIIREQRGKICLSEEEPISRSQVSDIWAVFPILILLGSFCII